MSKEGIANNIKTNFGIRRFSRYTPVGDSAGHYFVDFQGKRAVATSTGENFIDFYDDIKFYGNVQNVGEMFLCANRYDAVIVDEKMICDTFYEYDMRRAEDGVAFASRAESKFLLPQFEDEDGKCRILLVKDDFSDRWTIIEKDGKGYEKLDFDDVLEEFYRQDLCSREEILRHIDNLPEWLLTSCYENWCNYYASNIARMLIRLDGREKLRAITRMFDGHGLVSMNRMFKENRYLCTEIEWALINAEREFFVKDLSVKDMLKQSLNKILKRLDNKKGLSETISAQIEGQ